MIAGNQVRPKKWTNVVDLYDDGECSLISGNYDGNAAISIGIRWNGGTSDFGHPVQGNNPTWFILPDFLVNHVLSALLQQNNSQLQNIKNALRDFNK